MERFEWEQIPSLQKSMKREKKNIIYIIQAILIQIGFCLTRVCHRQ